MAAKKLASVGVLLALVLPVWALVQSTGQNVTLVNAEAGLVQANPDGTRAAMPYAGRV